MRSLAGLLLAPLLALILLAPSTDATSLIRLGERDMARGADWIVRGTVLSSQTGYRQGPVPVFTDVVVEVFELLKGELDETVLHVALPGGEIDGRRYEVAGTPSFQPGDEVVLFLVALPTGERTLLGFSQGSYRLHFDPHTGVEMAVRSTRGVSLHAARMPGVSTAQALRVGSPDREAWGLLRRRILGHLEGAP